MSLSHHTHTHRYHLGADHLIDFLEKRLMSTSPLVQPASADLHRLSLGYKVKTGSDLEMLLFGAPDENKSTGPKPQEEEVVAEATPEQKFQAMRLEARGICQVRLSLWHCIETLMMWL